MIVLEKIGFIMGWLYGTLILNHCPQLRQKWINKHLKEIMTMTANGC